MQVPPEKIELVPGYGVLLTKGQLDMALACGPTPTKLIRNLMSVFFTKEVLASSTACGAKGRTGLDSDIVSACISE